MTPDTAEMLPIIDISGFREGGLAATTVVEKVSAAATSSGFFMITGHGVNPVVTDRIYDLSWAFFDEVQDWKTDVGRGSDVLGGIAYSPIKEEALAGTLGRQTPGDLKESLNFGPCLAGDNWPSRPTGLQTAFEDYFAEMESLAGQLRRIFCRAIGLDSDFFENDFKSHLSALRVINYPEQYDPPEDGQLRAGEHTDYGFMTILRSEASAGGLQVQRRDKVWVDAPDIEGAYVVNIGDAFMRWSNDEWISTPHRVANPPSRYTGTARRQSIPFFLNPAAETVIKCLPPFLKDGARYPPISFADYISLKTRQAFGG